MKKEDEEDIENGKREKTILIAKTGITTTMMAIMTIAAALLVTDIYVLLFCSLLQFPAYDIF